jgi:hypothetical protein
MNTKLFVVGKTNPDNYLEWELQGLFENKIDALKICTTKYHFIGEAETNIDYGEKSVAFPNSYYPQLMNNHS